MKKLLSLLLLAFVAGACSEDESSPEPQPVPEPQPEALTQPAPVQTEVTENTLSVAWEAVEGAVGYVYTLQYRNEHGAVTPIVAETETTELAASFQELVPATEYTLRIKARGDGETTLDSAWAELRASTQSPAYLSGPWVEFEVSYAERNSYYCTIDVTFTPNDKTTAYYASCVYSSYFDDDPDDPDFIPNTEEDMINYLLAQKPVADNHMTDTSWGYAYDFILAVVGVDAEGNPGKLHWKQLRTMDRPSTGGSEQSEASVRIQHVVINSGELEGAPESCFAAVYRFEPVDGARTFRYEDGYYAGDFAKQEPSAWRDYFTNLSNAYGEGYDGYYAGWKSSTLLESSDGLYYYDVTFWDASMAGETYEVIYMAFDEAGVPGAPGSYTVTLPDELPAITVPENGSSTDLLRAATAALQRQPRAVRIPLRH